jgi:arabinofuranosyltransferase
VVGGDHFEYRVFSYLIPLLFLSAVALVDTLGPGRTASIALLSTFLLCSYPLPWLHWWRTRGLTTREDTLFLHQELAPELPFPLRPVVAAWDAWQGWLISHAICMRHQEHKVFFAWMSARLPSREEGAKVSWSGHPVIVASGVGVLGWVLPHVAVIDSLGLNDRVIAHTAPVGPRRRRLMMAHERQAPPGYVECFMPNVAVAAGRVQVISRAVPLTGEQIRACESRLWQPAAPAR